MTYVPTPFVIVFVSLGIVAAVWYTVAPSWRAWRVRRFLIEFSPRVHAYRTFEQAPVIKRGHR